jgi:hypothetical protein
MNQQAKGRMSQMPGRTPEDERLKRKMEDKDMWTTHNPTTKCCYSCEEEGHLSRNCSKKKESFPTTMVEYEENEVRDLLALEVPKRKKRMIKKKDNSEVQCFNCKELGHYARECPEPNKQDGVKKGIRLITCYKCKQKGHYSDKCSEKGAPRPQ